jgi:hypothetical protein
MWPHNGEFWAAAARPGNPPGRVSVRLWANPIKWSEGDDVNRSEQVKYYRASAATLREIAQGVMDPQAKVELLEIAERFERLASHAEGRHHGFT